MKQDTLQALLEVHTARKGKLLSQEQGQSRIQEQALLAASIIRQHLNGTVETDVKNSALLELASMALECIELPLYTDRRQS